MGLRLSKRFNSFKKVPGEEKKKKRSQVILRLVLKPHSNKYASWTHFSIVSFLLNFNIVHVSNPPSSDTERKWAQPKLQGQRGLELRVSSYKVLFTLLKTEMGIKAVPSGGGGVTVSSFLVSLTRRHVPCPLYVVVLAHKEPPSREEAGAKGTQQTTMPWPMMSPAC